MKTIYRHLGRLVTLGFFSCFCAFATGQMQSQKTLENQNATKHTATATAQPTATKAGAMPSAVEIATAKASGKVWVNLDSRIYHRGGRWYGKTKNGKFLTESEAKAAGYRKAKRS